MTENIFVLLSQIHVGVFSTKCVQVFLGVNIEFAPFVLVCSFPLIQSALRLSLSASEASFFSWVVIATRMSLTYSSSPTFTLVPVTLELSEMSHCASILEPDTRIKSKQKHAKETLQGGYARHTGKGAGVQIPRSHVNTAETW